MHRPVEKSVMDCAPAPATTTIHVPWCRYALLRRCASSLAFKHTLLLLIERSYQLRIDGLNEETFRTFVETVLAL
jgi:hypothetical protein